MVNMPGPPNVAVPGVRGAHAAQVEGPELPGARSLLEHQSKVSALKILFPFFHYHLKICHMNCYTLTSHYP